MSHIKKIYVDDGDRNIILNIIGRTFAGLSAKSAKNTFLLGVGSSGKSTCMNFCKLAFECYYKELKEDTFVKNNPKRDKIFNTYREDKHILMTVINEMIDDNIDSSSFKKNLLKEKLKQQFYMKIRVKMLNINLVYFLQVILCQN